MKSNIIITFLCMGISVSCYGLDLSTKLAGLGGACKPLVLQVNEKNQIIKSDAFQISESTIKNIDGASWELKAAFKPAPAADDAIDAEFTWTLVRGEAQRTAVALSFGFDHWAAENYVFAPASIYNGNRFEVKKIPWPTYLLYKDKNEYRIDAPTMINQCPHLNKSGAGRIDLETGNLSSPLMGFQSPKTQLGWMVQTTQGNRLGNHGFVIEEDQAHSNARFMITAPSIRLTRADGSYLRAPSGDKACDWEAGDSATIKCRIYVFRAPTVNAFLQRFLTARKDLNQREKNNTLPFSEGFRLLEKLYQDHRWSEESKLFRLNRPGKRRMVQIWQLGWVGGGQASLALLASGEEATRSCAKQNLETIFSKSQAKSGFFYTLGDGKKFIYDQFRPPVPPSMGMIRKNADWLYMSQRHFEILEAQGDTIPQAWMAGLRKHADAFFNLWDKYGQFGQWIDLETGDILVGNSTAGAIACGGLALAYKRFSHEPYLQAAQDAGRKYYKEYVAKGYTTGGPGEALSAPDSESAFGLLEGYMALYEVTGSDEWLGYAEELLSICASWTVSYDFEFPSNSPLGRVGTKACGSVWASVQNKHSAPGICTWSGDSLLKLYRAAGNVEALDLLIDISHGITQYISRKDRSLGGLPHGGICERVNTSDWEGKGNVGGRLFDSCSWCETAALLTFSQIPGLYVQPDTGLVAVFDNIIAEKVSSEANSIKLRLTNPTAFDAVVTVFCESSKMTKERVSFFINDSSQRIIIPANSTIETAFTAPGG